MATITRGTLVARSGGWRWQFYLDGQRDGRSFEGPKGKKAAWRYVDEVLRPALAAGLEREPDAWTVAYYLSQWLEVHLPTLRAQRSREAYQREVDRAIVPLLGAIKVRDLTSRDVARWANRWHETHSAKTVSLPLGLLKQALAWGMRQEPPLLLRNVAAGVKAPSDAEMAPKPQAFTVAEMLVLIASLKPPLGAGIGLGLLGLRVGEVCGIRRRQDLDFDARVIHVCQKVIRHKQLGLVLEPPKRGHARSVPMPDWLVPVLKAQLAWSVTARNQTDLLFTVRRRSCGAEHSEDSPVHVEKMERHLHDVCRELGLPDLVFHSLRHTFAMVMRKSGMSDVDIAAALGHASTRQLVALYGNHPDHELARNARLAGAMDAILDENRTIDSTNTG